MHKNISFLIIAITFFVLGGGLGYFIFNKNCPMPDKKNTYTDGWQAARERLENLGIIVPLDKKAEIKRLNGVINNIEDNKLTLKIIPIEPLADPDLDNRQVIVDADTKIFQVALKNQEEYDSELKEYKANYPNYKDLVNTDDFPTPPTRIENQLVSVGELLIGMRVIINSDKNLVSAKEFKAKEIIIQPN